MKGAMNEGWRIKQYKISAVNFMESAFNKQGFTNLSDHCANLWHIFTCGRMLLNLEIFYPIYPLPKCY